MSHQTLEKAVDPVAGAHPSDAGRIALHPRNVVFDFSNSPLQWIPGEPVASHTLSALNLGLPVGELMFIDMFSRALPRVHDERLREDMIGFIGQEQMHSNSHDHALHEYFLRNGIDLSVYADFTNRFFAQFKKRMDQVPERFQRRIVAEALAVIAGVEHVTATAGNWLMNHDFEGFGADPVITDLFCWHGAEELEHRSVAWEAARYFGAGRARLNFYYLAACVTITVGLAAGGMLIARSDPAVPKCGPVRWMREVLRAMSRGSLISFATLGEAFRSYMRPDFTPECVGDTAQAVAYLAKSPAAKAAAWA